MSKAKVIDMCQEQVAAADACSWLLLLMPERLVLLQQQPLLRLLLLLVPTIILLATTAVQTHCVGRSRSLKLKGRRTALKPSSLSLYTTVAKSAAIQVELPASNPSTIVLPFWGLVQQ